MKKGLVSIVIPVKNSASMLRSCLETIRNQTYTPIEVIIVDSNSHDGTSQLAKKCKAALYQYHPNVPSGYFDAPMKRNFGAGKANGEYIYYVDADMELPKTIIHEAVELCRQGADAITLSEDSFGNGVWARAKNLERMCYWGDDTVEAPRFVKTSVWKHLGGLDTSLGGGGDDWDLAMKLKDGGYTIRRTASKIRHNEGTLTLEKLFRKRYMYGRDSLKYISKRPKAAIVSYFPIRMAYIRNWKLFLSRPLDTLLFIIMRTVEYSAGLLGIIVRGF